MQRLATINFNIRGRAKEETLRGAFRTL